MVTARGIETEIRGMVEESPLNRLSTAGSGPIFDRPLVGVADGRDPLFDDYRRIIGTHYLTPSEVIAWTADAEGRPLQHKGVSVVCWVLPFAEEVRRSNRENNALPASKMWTEGQELGEKVNNDLRQRVARFFRDRGFLAVAPMSSPFYARFGRYITNWSERHALYVAGMGTFSLSRWLITERGVAMRCGSVVVNAELAPTRRRYLSYTENCLYYASGTCRACIERCPAEAIDPDGLDKPKCREYLDAHARIEGCGLCQTAVPCEAEIPGHGNPGYRS